MKVHAATFVLINTLIIFAVIVGVAVVGWWLLNTNIDTTEAEIEARFIRLEASAFVYQNRLGFYEGVCNDIGVASDLRCNETEQSFAIEATLPRGGYYCLDSTGFMSKTKISKGVGTVCRQ